MTLLTLKNTQRRKIKNHELIKLDFFLKHKQIRKKIKQNYKNSKKIIPIIEQSKNVQYQCCQQNSNIKCLKIVYSMIRDIASIIKFQLDSYLACLKILQQMSFIGNLNLCRVVAAAIISIVGKVHEFRIPSYQELIKWGSYSFLRFELLSIEAQILSGIGFQVPLVNSFENMQQFLFEIYYLDQYFTSL